MAQCAPLHLERQPLSPYATLHLLVTAPLLATAMVWTVASFVSTPAVRAVLIAGAIALAGHVGWELWEVWGGAPGWADGGLLREPLRWLVYGGLLWVTAETDSARMDAKSVLLGVGCLLAGAWLPGLVFLGRSRGATLRVRGLVGFALLATSVWGRRMGFLWLAEQLGFLGLGIDGTTVAAWWTLGAIELLGWTLSLLEICHEPRGLLPLHRRR